MEGPDSLGKRFMTAQDLSRDHIPHAHLMRAVLDGHYLQWFCRNAMQWEPFATQTHALRALLLDNGMLIRIKPATENAAFGASETPVAASTSAYMMALTTHLTWWPQYEQTVYRAVPDGPTGSEPLVWKASSEQRLYFEKHLLYVDEYSAMAAWRAKRQPDAPESNVIYCEFAKSVSSAPSYDPERQPVYEPSALRLPSAFGEFA